MKCLLFCQTGFPIANNKTQIRIYIIIHAVQFEDLVSHKKIRNLIVVYFHK